MTRAGTDAKAAPGVAATMATRAMGDPEIAKKLVWDE